MLTWTERESAQKNPAGTVVKAPTAQAPCEAPLDGLNGLLSLPVNVAVLSDVGACLSASAKRRATLKAGFALLGRELHFVRKGGREHFEVRHHTGSYACSTEADLRGLLSRIGASA